MGTERRRPGRSLFTYGLAGLGLAFLALLGLHLLLGRRLLALRQQSLAADLAPRLVLAELALERITPASLAEIGGLRLVLGPTPEPRGATPDPDLRRQSQDLRRLLCLRLGRCPDLRPAGLPPRGVWVAVASSLETVWLFVPLPPLPGWPPDPLLVALALGIGGLGAGFLYLSREVQRPLRRLGQAVATVNHQPGDAQPLALAGSLAVQTLTARFNAMVDRLEHGRREQATMLAGIAHDLRAPLTRLRLRFELAPDPGQAAVERRRALGDLEALERITRQFLQYAGLDAEEPPLPVALDALVAELAVLADPTPLELVLEPLVRRVRPTTLGRAVANLIDNAVAHGRPPLVLELAADGEEGFLVTVWDHGAGLSDAAWSRAVEPFQRLDPSRSGSGHCGLGLAIALRIARDHGGGLEPRRGPHGFGVALRGQSIATRPAEA